MDAVMRFKGLDLNLLLAFDVLLETRSVTRAAERMHLSQAAMSSALGRLREYFGNEILVVSGKRMYPTAFAQALVPQVRDCVRQLDSLVSAVPAFDPESSRRSFRLVTSDYLTTVVLAPLMSRLATSAPGVRLDILLPSDFVQKQIEDGDVDLLITPEGYVSPDLPSELLFEERQVVAGWSSNPLLKGPITEEQFFAAGHVGVMIGNHHISSYADRFLQSSGRVRRLEVIAPSFTTVPALLENTLRLSLMHERLARAMTARFAIALAPVPFDMPPLREMVQYHFARAKDEGLIWLREQLHQTVRLLSTS
jgi:LysR family transcriptional regulator, nod-box dependent transcriptional activator